MLIEIQNIEQLRKVKWLSYEDLEKQNLSRGTYHSIVRWTRPVSDRSIQKLTQIFDVRKEEILPLIDEN